MVSIRYLLWRAVVVPALCLSWSVMAHAEWTLEAAVRRAREIAPETRVADADVAARAGELRTASSFPNPTIDIRADDKLGQEDGRGGTDFTQLALSQPLPLRRLERERRAAQARLASSEAARRYRLLQIERETAEVFYATQLAQDRLALARERLAQTDIYPGGEQRRDPLKRYLAPFDRARLAILHEEANQAIAVAEREHQKALTGLRVRLGLPADASVEVASAVLPPAPSAFDTLARDLDNYPAVATARSSLDAAVAGVDAARSQRFADPSLNLFRERDVLANERRDVTGIGISVQVPLWNTNRGPIDKAVAEAARAQAELDVERRDALARVQTSYTELTRLRLQLERVRDKLLEPARKLHELARRSFSAGEVNVLALIDAANAYYDARSRYLELLAQAQLTAAELRLATGASLVDSLDNAEVRP